MRHKSLAHIIQGSCDAIPLASQSVDLAFGSPPYGPQRTYGINAQRGIIAWVDWMLGCVREMCRVCRGLVLVNCAGWSTKRIYQPGPEMLMSEWFRAGGVCWRPAYWHRVGIPGSGGKHWLRADIEYVLCFKANAEWPEFSDNTANGHPPKWGPGGEMSNRLSDGTRVNQWGHSFATGGVGGSRDNPTCGPARPSHFVGEKGELRQLIRGTSGNRPGGTTIYHPADRPLNRAVTVIANPGNLVAGITTGGGKLGSTIAHENEAPFPERLAEWFIKGWCKPGGIVLDCFSGSGTTAVTASRMGRIGIGMDLRFNQCQLGLRRLAEKPKRKTVDVEPGLFDSAKGVDK